MTQRNKSDESSYLKREPLKEEDSNETNKGEEDKKSWPKGPKK